MLYEKTKIISIIGVAGATETGNVDDLKLLSGIAKKYNIWFHVDAVWGGALLLSNQHKKLLERIENADSVKIDGHKFLYFTMSHSAVLSKDKYPSFKSTSKPETSIITYRYIYKSLKKQLKIVQKIWNSDKKNRQMEIQKYFSKVTANFNRLILNINLRLQKEKMEKALFPVQHLNQLGKAKKLSYCELFLSILSQIEKLLPKFL